MQSLNNTIESIQNRLISNSWGADWRQGRSQPGSPLKNAEPWANATQSVSSVSMLPTIVKTLLIVALAAVTSYGGYRFSRSFLANHKSDVKVATSTENNGKTHVTSIETSEETRHHSEEAKKDKFTKLLDEVLARDGFESQLYGANPAYYYKHPQLDFALDFRANPQLARLLYVEAIEDGFRITYRAIVRAENAFQNDLSTFQESDRCFIESLATEPIVVRQVTAEQLQEEIAKEESWQHGPYVKVSYVEKDGLIFMTGGRPMNSSVDKSTYRGPIREMLYRLNIDSYLDVNQDNNINILDYVTTSNLKTDDYKFAGHWDSEAEIQAIIDLVEENSYITLEASYNLPMLTDGEYCKKFTMPVPMFIKKDPDYPGLWTSPNNEDLSFPKAEETFIEYEIKDLNSDGKRDLILHQSVLAGKHYRGDVLPAFQHTFIACEDGLRLVETINLADVERADQDALFVEREWEHKLEDIRKRKGEYSLIYFYSVENLGLNQDTKYIFNEAHTKPGETWGWYAEWTIYENIKGKLTPVYFDLFGHNDLLIQGDKITSFARKRDPQTYQETDVLLFRQRSFQADLTYSDELREDPFASTVEIDPSAPNVKEKIDQLFSSGPVTVIKYEVTSEQRDKFYDNDEILQKLPDKVTYESAYDYFLEKGIIKDN